MRRARFNLIAAMIYKPVTKSLYYSLRRFQFKKDIPADLRAFEPFRIDFGLWGLWYVPRTPEGLALAAGGALPFHLAFTVEHGSLIGQRDLEAGAGKPWEEAWRESYRAAIADKMKLPA